MTMKTIEEIYGSLLPKSPKSPKSKAYKRKVPQTPNDYKRLAHAKIKRDKKRLDRVEDLARALAEVDTIRSER